MQLLTATVLSSLTRCEFGPKWRMLAESNAAHGSLAQCIVSAPEKYKARQIGHSKAALHKPIREKNRDIWPNVVSPITFLKRTYEREIRFF